MAKAIFEIDSLFFKKALYFSKSFENVCLFQSNDFQDQYSNVSSLLAIGANDFISINNKAAFDQIENFKSQYPNQWIPGFLGYDLKNEQEDLTTRHPNEIGFPDAYFFLPEIILEIDDNQVQITADNPQIIFHNILISEENQFPNVYHGQIRSRMSRDSYIQAFNSLKKHIQLGDLYEANLCQEFYDDNAQLSNPEDLYLTLNEISPTPFSSFFKINDKYILSASPERFLAKRANVLISQPIKGTAARGINQELDDQLKLELSQNTKEIAENVMIVDLVRNDLTRSAVAGTVKVVEKLGVYTFKHVHQMISTITCEKNQDLSDLEVLKRTFPAGSMTGAPKISALQLCDRYENSRRGIYAGAIGYFAPNGDFDFNVVIRTILYNRENKYLSFHTGSAITIEANAASEYAECLVKASAILKALGKSID
ncbi:MAG: anthranilate synthase component I family protein [Sphingobacterium sp.]